VFCCKTKKFGAFQLGQDLLHKLHPEALLMWTAVPIWEAQVAFRMEMGLVMLEHISGLAQIVDRWGTIIQTVHSKVSPVPKLSDETLLQRHLLQALKKSAVSVKRCVCCWQPTLKQIVEDVFIGVDPAPVTFSSGK
jgi:hypothetical protein